MRLLCISTSAPYSHALNTVVMLGLVLLVAAWNCWISYKYGYAGLLVLHLLLLLNPWLTVESLFYRYYIVRCSSELVDVPPPYSCGRCTRYCDRLYDFSVTYSRCYNDVYTMVSFLAYVDPGILSLWNVFL